MLKKIAPILAHRHTAKCKQAPPSRQHTLHIRHVWWSWRDKHTENWKKLISRGELSEVFSQFTTQLSLHSPWSHHQSATTPAFPARLPTADFEMYPQYGAAILLHGPYSNNITCCSQELTASRHSFLLGWSASELACLLGWVCSCHIAIISAEQFSVSFLMFSNLFRSDVMHEPCWNLKICSTRLHKKDLIKKCRESHRKYAEITKPLCYQRGLANVVTWP